MDPMPVWLGQKNTPKETLNWLGLLPKSLIVPKRICAAYLPGGR
jgi:hypothetical protein